MVLSDFLLRQKTDDTNPHEIIPVSFSLRRVLHENYYRLDNLKTPGTETETDKYLVQTRSQAKSSGIKVQEVHGVDKGLIPHVRAEHQRLVAPTMHPTPPPHHTRPMHQTQPIDQGLPTNVVPPIPKPKIGQGRAGIEESLR